jgi:hypothetical protein
MGEELRKVFYPDKKRILGIIMMNLFYGSLFFQVIFFFMHDENLKVLLFIELIWIVLGLMEFYFSKIIIENRKIILKGGFLKLKKYTFDLKDIKEISNRRSNLKGLNRFFLIRTKSKKILYRAFSEETVEEILSFFSQVNFYYNIKFYSKNYDEKDNKYIFNYFIIEKTIRYIGIVLFKLSFVLLAILSVGDLLKDDIHQIIPYTSHKDYFNSLSITPVTTLTYTFLILSIILILFSIISLLFYRDLTLLVLTLSKNRLIITKDKIILPKEKIFSKEKMIEFKDISSIKDDIKIRQGGSCGSRTPSFKYIKESIIINLNKQRYRLKEENFKTRLDYLGARDLIFELKSYHNDMK